MTLEATQIDRAQHAGSKEAPILELENVSKRFTKRIDLAAKLVNVFGFNYRDRTVHAVDRVNLTVARGEVVGLIGESGCGKSTLGRVIAGIHDPTEGVLRFEGRDLASLNAEEARKEWVKIQMIFQDPMSSLNPRKRVVDTIGEAPVYHLSLIHI